MLPYENSYFLSLTEVCEMLGLTRPAFWRLRQQDKDFPPGIRIALGKVVYLKSEVEAWLKRRVAEGRVS